MKMRMSLTTHWGEAATNCLKKSTPEENQKKEL
jgi:hypothetical protein